MNVEEARYFKNNFITYDENEELLDENNHIIKKYYDVIFDHIVEFLGEYLKDSSKISPTFKSIYIGTLGVCMGLDKLWKFNKIYPHNYASRLFDECKLLLENFLKKITPIESDSLSFLEGVAGYYAFLAVYYAKQEPVKSRYYFDEMILVYKKKIGESKFKGDVNEILYGRAGFLYALIYVIRNSDNIVTPDILNELCASIIESGKQHPPFVGYDSPLNYTFHKSYYLGAAHGYAGIFYMLLDDKIRNIDVVSNNMEIIMKSVDELFKYAYSSGNLPSSLPKRHDKLVQWCHGGPGAIYLAIRCYKITNDEKYLKIAETYAEDIWKRGILIKSIGLCHGVSGNAYAFLAIYNCTKNQKYLYYALMFAKWICQKKPYYQPADRPMSLYEGLMGVLYFLVDLYSPTQAMFPAFQTSID